jgi:DNA-binding response OmpR family regulator
MRILVVEDQFGVAQTLKEKLEAECYAVDVEHDATPHEMRRYWNHSIIKQLNYRI